MSKDYQVEISDVHYFKRGSVFSKEYKKTFPRVSGIIIQWTATVGWGELTICKYEDGSIEIDSECMSKEFVSQVLSAYTQYILDKGVFI